MVCCFSFYKHFGSRRAKETPDVSLDPVECEQMQSSLWLAQRCNELQAEQHDLCHVRDEVVATIAQCLNCSGHNPSPEESTSTILHDDMEQDVDDIRSEPASFSEEIAGEVSDIRRADHQRLFDLSHQLEAENEQLREALFVAAETLACLAERSQHLGQHLEAVSKKVAQVSRIRHATAVPQLTLSSKQDSLKPLLFLDVASSHASSSTATPRSDVASDRRTASAPQSARSTSAACWCDA